MNIFKKTRHGLCAVAMTTALALNPFVAQAQETVKLAHAEGEGNLLENPYWALTQVLGSELETGTNGRYTLQVFPNKQLGDTESITEQTARGVIQMATSIASGQLASFFPSIQILDMPYTFNSTDEARAVLDGPFGQELADAAAKESGVRILAYLPSAFRNFSSSKAPIHSPADMVGQKIRVQPIPIHLKIVESLGASATPIAWAELYNALQTGVADGQENAPYVLLLANLQEVQKYYTLDKHLLNVALIVANEDFYQSLSDADKAVLNSAVREAKLAFLGIVKAKESQDLKKIADAGVEIYQPTPEEFEQFVDATRDPVRELLAETVDQEWFDKLDSAIAEVRAKNASN
ncbi:TRAP transporter substrate-binding protein [Chelativorans xinjiangense]|uniref:TRAP transporter substrate-binding protein n=1 Tax=Chelativorans xinjiangense TaxID=2681485 RepID=UPI001357E154|nr:TRAP transporter substrate-binding protein DctP [Chelativorans xinjiangense]